MVNGLFDLVDVFGGDVDVWCAGQLGSDVIEAALDVEESGVEVRVELRHGQEEPEPGVELVDGAVGFNPWVVFWATLAVGE